MAAPVEKTIKDLNGKWVMNKSLSSDVDPVLKIQGIPYLARKAASLVNASTQVKQFEAPPKPGGDGNGAPDIVTHIDTTQTIAGIKGGVEERCLDNVVREQPDAQGGVMHCRSQWVGPRDIEEQCIRDGWLVEGEEDGKPLILTHLVHEKAGWEATQIWGFQMVNEERRFCASMLASKGNEREYVRVVYDYAL
ncbi:hypothetical protein BX600DRAFT_516126 [Xylariales sp. PMI_506]|nr:hypothetical protein BX600DRAFT_516126 [Xylariales sp. PMI_506]